MKILTVVCLLLLFWGFFVEPGIIVIKKYKIKNEDLKKCRAVFVSDFHIAPWQKKRLKRIVKLINKQNPDIVFSAGDFVRGYSPNKTLPIENIADELSKIKTKHGFFTVLGNHDWWQNGAQIRDVLTEHKITVLENSSVKLKIKNQNITIAGIEDLQTRIPDTEKALRHADTTTILLTHNPDPFFELDSTVFLTLAGHNHGGQVQLPFFGALIVPSSSGRRYANGLFKINNNRLLVTKGLGNSIMNVRFCCPPEIVVIDFV